MVIVCSLVLSLLSFYTVSNEIQQREMQTKSDMMFLENTKDATEATIITEREKAKERLERQQQIKQGKPSFEQTKQSLVELLMLDTPFKRVMVLSMFVGCVFFLYGFLHSPKETEKSIGV